MRKEGEPMKKTPLNPSLPQGNSPMVSKEANDHGKIHPVIVFPFVWRAEKSNDADPNRGEEPRTFVNRDLTTLYEELIRPLNFDKAAYARPITVMDKKTRYNNVRYKHAPEEWRDAFEGFLKTHVEEHSDLVEAWCVDSCQVWNTGLGAAFERGGDKAVYWLIPGDFNYSAKPKVLETMKMLPDAILKGQDLCVGEIRVDVTSSKQLIDTYGTYGLLYNWFPHEAKEIRKKTDKPRSEFFAIKGSFLEEVLRQRWYAYEQTIVILLQAIAGKKQIAMEKLGDITDLPEGRETVAAAMAQVERTERVLKSLWREGNEHKKGWIDEFRVLDQQSEQVRGAALVILQNVLR
jgi:hypothetical protein